MSNLKHQLIKYSNESEFNNIDPSTKSLFEFGENVVICQEKKSLISLRSLKANNYECPLCRKKLNSDLAIVGAANINVGSKKEHSPSYIFPSPTRTFPVLWGSLAIIMILCLVVAAIGLFANLGNPSRGSNPDPINISLGLTSTPILAQPRSTNTARNTLHPEPTKTALINNNSNNYAEISCSEINKANLRRTPGYVGKNDSTDSLYEVPCGETVELLGSTKKVDGLTWWNVYWNGYTGWIADHTGSGKIILDFNP